MYAENYPMAEMKHVPIALIDENKPVILLAINNRGTMKKGITDTRNQVA